MMNQKILSGWVTGKTAQCMIQLSYDQPTSFENDKEKSKSRLKLNYSLSRPYFRKNCKNLQKLPYDLSHSFMRL